LLPVASEGLSACDSTNLTHSHTHKSTHLCIGHISVEHLHLGIDIVSLLALIQGAIVPHQEVEGWVELSDVVRPPYPGLFLTVGSKAVAAVRIACSHNEDIVWNGLQDMCMGGEGGSFLCKNIPAPKIQTCNLAGKTVDHLHFHQMFCQQ